MISVGKNRLSGFTIVEILIVVVVVAALASVVAVSYSGITDRAKRSAIQQNLMQAGDLLQVYSIHNKRTFPVSLEAAEETTDIALTVYLVDTENKNYCATLTDGAFSYSISSMLDKPVEGVCVENLAKNPSAAADITFWSLNQNGQLISRSATQSRPGSHSSGSVMTTLQTLNSITTQLWNGSATALVPVGPDEKLTISGWVKADVAGRSMSMNARWRSASISEITPGSSIPSASMSTSWNRISFTSAAAPEGTVYGHVGFIYINGQPGDVFYIDDVMVTVGEIDYEYGDGDSPGWFWTGTPNASSSIGPSVPL